MKKRIVCLLLCVALWLMASSAGAVTLRTASPFAGADAAAEDYVELLKAFEETAGCKVEDESATSDEAWKTAVLNDFAVGNEPDVLFFFAASADSSPILYRVVPIDEINAAYPDMNLPENASLREADGRVYAIPVRTYWEGLLVNTDLFEQYGLELPTTWDRLETAIRRFREEGVVPIAVSLSDIPHYLAEFAMMACCTPEEQSARPMTLEEVPESWYEAMALIRHLYQLGAFADNATATTEALSSQLFRDKKAAMQIDGSWFANSIPASSMDTTVVLPMPSCREDQSAKACIGGVSMGFYLTRRAWETPDKRDLAVQLLGWFTSEEHLSQLGGYNYSGRLMHSAFEMIDQSEVMLTPLQDAMNKEAREVWLLDCITAVAEGSMTPEECWALVMSYHPFEP